MVRHIVREAVAKIAKEQDPADPLGAADAVFCCYAEQPRSADGVEIHLLAVAFDLDENSRASLADYDATDRSDRQRRNAVLRQTEGLRDLLADPRLGPTWLLRHHPQLVGQTDELLRRMAVPPPAAGSPQSDDPLVDLLRDFVAPMASPAQRLLVLHALPAILRGLNREELAARAELLTERELD